MKLMGSHPGGISLTKRLLELSDIVPPAWALDLGAGSGESVRYLVSRGFWAVGVDLDVDENSAGDSGKKRTQSDKDDEGKLPECFTGQRGQASKPALDRKKSAKYFEECTSGRVLCQDMTRLDFMDEVFDVCLAECSISVCGDGMAALGEAWRVLKPGGNFLISDIFFEKKTAPAMSMEGPLTWECWETAFRNSGFTIQTVRDETELWKEFFLESLWNGSVQEKLCNFFRAAGRAKCGYFIAWLKKPDLAGKQERMDCLTEKAV